MEEDVSEKTTIEAEATEAAEAEAEAADAEVATNEATNAEVTTEATDAEVTTAEATGAETTTEATETGDTERPDEAIDGAPASDPDDVREALRILGREGEPDKATIDAMNDMIEAAREAKDGKDGKGSTDAIDFADKLDRAMLIRTISYQIPDKWLSSDVAKRIDGVPTESLALILSWLSLSWWAGFDWGTAKVLEALKIAAEKHVLDEKKRESLAGVEAEVKRERAERVKEDGV